MTPMLSVHSCCKPEPWGSPLDRAGEALALHDTKLDPAMGKIAWRSIHPDVRAAYIERARVVLDAFRAVGEAER